MKALIISVIVLFASFNVMAQCNNCVVITIDNNSSFPPQELTDALLDPTIDRICLKPTTIPTKVTTITSIELINKELYIQNGMRVNFEGDDVGLKMKSGSSLKGDNHNGSRLTKSGSGEAVSMEDCDGCTIEDIGIQGKIGDSSTGTTIDEDSEDVEVSSVTYTNFDQDGILVNADGVTGTDLTFFSVAIDESDCCPETGYSAIYFEGASECRFSNVLHNRSVGAITIKLTGSSNNNRVLNVTVEQEGSHCHTMDRQNCDLPNDKKGDPSFSIGDDACKSGNYFFANLLSGKVGLYPTFDCNGVNTAFCFKNTLITNTTSAICDGGDSNSGCN